MIAYLDGILTDKQPTLATVEAGGVGYELLIPVSTYGRLPAAGQRVRLLTYFHVRADLQQLYGFATPEEKQLFRLLITVTGIGPKIALTILSGASPSQFRQRIIAGDIKALTLIPGIGAKTARRIIVELREKFVPGDDQLPESPEPTGQILVPDEALQALLSLGYRRSEAFQALKKASATLGNQAALEQLIKTALLKM